MRNVVRSLVQQWSFLEPLWGRNHEASVVKESTYLVNAFKMHNFQKELPLAPSLFSEVAISCVKYSSIGDLVQIPIISLPGSSP